MMSSAEVGKVLDFETGLQRLVTRGYQFLHRRDANGAVREIVGIRVHDNVVDLVRLSAEDDVTAMRMPGDEESVFSPKSVLWQCAGSAGVVLAETLALPDHAPGAPLAPGRSKPTGCWITDDRGSAKWLAASG